MRIALAHFRVGETDGVSLEMEKWKLSLEKMGHEVVFLAGNTDHPNTYVIDELHYQHPFNNKVVYNAYHELVDYDDEHSFKEDILRFANLLEKKLINFITNYKIDLIIPNNIFSLGWGLPAAIAFYNALKKTNTAAICHHHDFYWEREKYKNPTCDFIKELLITYFPPKDDNFRHIVINKIAQENLFKKRGIWADVIPNVFDFLSPTWTVDEYNRDFRENTGLHENDIVILQATRIVERKAIELGIEVVYEMQQENHLDELKRKGLYNGKKFNEYPKFVYVLAGMPEADFKYIEMLKNKAKSLGVDMRFIHDYIKHTRTIKDNKKIYSLWDAYVHADLVIYPSIIEGWGNQLLEAVYAKKPTVIYEYPVYRTDIADKNFSFISLGDTHRVEKNGLVQVNSEIVKNAASQCIQILQDEQIYRTTTEKNFLIGKKYYSYEALNKYLERILSNQLVSGAVK